MKISSTVAVLCLASCLGVAADNSQLCFQVEGRRNQIGFYPDLTECHYYFQCFYYNSTYAVGTRRACSPGLYWNDGFLQCMPESSMPCEDPCLNDITARGCYRGTGCRQFYVCANAASYGMCCPKESAFNQVTCACEASKTCTDACVGIPFLPNSFRQIDATHCKDSLGNIKGTVEGEPDAYIRYDANEEPTGKINCPGGVEFILAACHCDDFSDGTTRRQAILWLPFDVDAKDQSPNKLATDLINGAKFDSSVSASGGGGSLLTNGGWIEVPGLMGYDFSVMVASFCAFFRCESESDFSCISAGGILSNSLDSTASYFTIILAITAENGLAASVNFLPPTGKQQLFSSFSPPSNGWNQACIVYRNNVIKFYVNGEMADSQYVASYLTISKAPFTIGNDQAVGEFVGHIDNVLVTPFAMAPTEILAYFNGNFSYLQSLGFF